MLIEVQFSERSLCNDSPRKEPEGQADLRHYDTHDGAVSHGFSFQWEEQKYPTDFAGARSVFSRVSEGFFFNYQLLID